MALLRGAHGASFSTAERQSFSTAMEAVPSWCWEQSLKLFQEIHGILGGMAGMCQTRTYDLLRGVSVPNFDPQLSR